MSTHKHLSTYFTPQWSQVCLRPHPSPLSDWMLMLNRWAGRRFARRLNLCSCCSARMRPIPIWTKSGASRPISFLKACRFPAWVECFLLNAQGDFRLVMLGGCRENSNDPGIQSGAHMCFLVLLYAHNRIHWSMGGVKFKNLSRLINFTKKFR